MLVFGMALVMFGYALAVTGAEAIQTDGAAPGLLYNLSISSDPAAGRVDFRPPDQRPGAGFGGAAGSAAAQGGQLLTAVGPAMPSPTAGGTPVRVI